MIWEIKKTGKSKENAKSDVFSISMLDTNDNLIKLNDVAGSLHGILIELSDYIREYDILKTPEGVIFCLPEQGYPNN